MNNPNKLAHEWLKAADDDFQYAQVGLGQTELYANICFSCQQSFEKYLKAFLITHQIDFPKTHDLTKLLSLCLKIDPGFADFKEAAATLTPYGVATRYPDIGDMEFSKEQAKQALDFTKQLQNFVKKDFDK